MASTVKNGNDRIGFGGTVNKLCWLPYYSANVLSGEFYCGTETFQLRYVVRNYAHTRWIAALPPCDSENRKNHASVPKPVGRLLHLFIDCSQLAFAQASKQRFYLSILKNLTLARLLLRHYFVSLICFFSAWLQTDDDWQYIDQSRCLVHWRTKPKSATRRRRVFGQAVFLSFPLPRALAPDRFSRAFKMEPAIANSAFFPVKNTQTACNQAIVNTIHFISVG